MNQPLSYDPLDKQIINALQGGFPIVDEPFEEVASWFDIDANELIDRVEKLLETGALSRFGPLYNSERMGGAVTLAALCVPAERFEEVVQIVNEHPQVAHNYARDHKLNMWFVISTETQQEIKTVIRSIEQQSGLTVYNCPKEKEFFIGLKLEA
jgi:DNA-binding Lrp family transcriptional regulator